MPRIQYPAMREMNWQRAPRSAEPNGWSVAHDAHAWASARSHTQYKNDRPRYDNQLPSYSAMPFYNSDEGPKAGVSKRAETSGARYSAMTVASSTRRPFFSASHGPAPGAYSPVIHDWGYNRLFVPQPGSPAFVDGQARVDPRTIGLAHARWSAEPVFSSLEADQKAWRAQGRGGLFSSGQRFKRPAGPGSNVPAMKVTPAPGAHSSMHSWPNGGFMGTAHGYNHNRT